jgi:hypothetical protein
MRSLLPGMAETFHHNLMAICCFQYARDKWANPPIPIEKRAMTTDKRIGRKALRSVALHKYAWTSGIYYAFVLNWEAGSNGILDSPRAREEREELTLVNSGMDFK